MADQEPKPIDSNLWRAFMAQYQNIAARKRKAIPPPAP